MKPAALITFIGAALVSGCFNPQFQQGVPCSADRECPEGQICHTDDRCYDPDQIPEQCSEGFIECVDETTARVCDVDGNEVEVDCGAAGCSADSGCGECVASTATCDGDVLERCGPDGTLAGRDTCAAGCIDSTASVDAHCGYLSPKYLPDICDELAEEESFVVSTSATIDTALDENCNGGIVQQADGPEVCVLRYGTFRVEADATLDVDGDRAIAIVADESIGVFGVFDVSADGTVNGPGGGSIVTSGSGDIQVGGGGSGFREPGASGGSTASGGGANGGSAIDPVPLASLIGGPHGGSSGSGLARVFGGGGGGAATLIACRGLVTIAEGATIDAGGGGGNGSGGLIAACSQTPCPAAGGGGGAGGQVVIQALEIELVGRMFANGGAGGAGGDHSASGTDGTPGGDGSRSATSAASGGNAPAGSGDGGDGGIQGTPPGVGLARSVANDTAGGGGGGSTGFLRIVAPSGTAQTVNPAAVSPALSPTEAASIR